MMPTLLLRLAGPMQSWGTQSRFSVRDTGLEPSKSAVVGLLCAALGKPREEREGDGFPTVAELAALRMGVRVNHEGVPRVDYHTAGGTHRRGERYGVVKASGAPGDTVTSRRHYLSDADFLVGLEGDAELLARLDAALARPRWQIFLGRKSFVPGVPARVPGGVREASLLDALRDHAPQAEEEGSGVEPGRWRFVYDSSPDEATEVRADFPLSFSARRHTLRYVKTDFFVNPRAEARKGEEADEDVSFETSA
jgi:CRISPR system Cascade subunit CasD